jgi:hypothetical protein
LLWESKKTPSIKEECSLSLSRSRSLSFHIRMASARTSKVIPGRKQRWGRAQVLLLNGYLATEVLPARAHRDLLAMLLGTSSRRVQIWFQNHRAGNTAAPPLLSPPFFWVDRVPRPSSLPPPPTSEHASEAPALSASQLAALLRDGFDDTKRVGDAVFDELRACVALCDAAHYDAALLRCVALSNALVEHVVPEAFKRRQERRHWYAVLVTCVCEVLKHWARRVLARSDGVPLADCIVPLCCAFDAAERLSAFMVRVNIPDVARSAVGNLAAAVVNADHTAVVSNDVIDAADALMRQTAAIIGTDHLLAAIASMLPSTCEAGRPEAHGMHTRLTPDGVIDAPLDMPSNYVVVGDLPAVLCTAPAGSNKRDRSIDGVAGVRAVSIKAEASHAPLHAALPGRTWTPYLLPSATTSSTTTLSETTDSCSSPETPPAAMTPSPAGDESPAYSPPTSASPPSSSSSSSSSSSTTIVTTSTTRRFAGDRRKPTTAVADVARLPEPAEADTAAAAAAASSAAASTSTSTVTTPQSLDAVPLLLFDAPVLDDAAAQLLAAEDSFSSMLSSLSFANEPDLIVNTAGSRWGSVDASCVEHIRQVSVGDSDVSAWMKVSSDAVLPPPAATSVLPPDDDGV